MPPLLASLMVLGCSDRREVERRGAATEAAGERPRGFIGKQVTLVGEIGDVQGEQAFVLEDNDWIFGEEVLVLSSSPVRLGAKAPAEGDDVVVTGSVRTFSRADAERELGGKLTDEVPGKWEGKPVIVARTVESIERGSRWSADEGGTTKILNLWTVYTTPRPEALAGSEIELGNVVVRSKAGKGMWVGYRHGAQIFVIPSRASVVAKLEPGSRVNVRGKLRVMPPAKQAIEQWGIRKQLGRQIAEEPLYISGATVEKAGEGGRSARATPAR